MQKKILIAAALYPPETRGPATFAKQLVEYLEKHEWEVAVVPFRLVRSLPPLVRHIVYFFKLLAAGRGAALVVALDPVSVGLPALCAARLTGKRCVLRVGGDYAWEQGVQHHGITERLDEFVLEKNETLPFMVRLLRRIQAAVARGAVAVVTPSRYLKHIVARWDVDPKKISVIHSTAGAAPKSFSRSELRARLGWRSEPVVFSLGQLVPWKGFPALIDAVASLRPQFPDIRLLIAGGGEQQDLRTHAREAGFDPATVFLGELPNTALRELLAAADVFTLNTGYEGLSHALIEAMQAQVPIVTTDAGGNPELIEQGVSGLMVPFNDTGALAAAIRQLLTNKKRARGFALRAYAAAQAFRPEKSMRAWERLLNTICESY